MASASRARSFSLPSHAPLLDEHDRMFFQPSHPAGTDAERATFQERPEGFSASLFEKVQRESHAVHLDQRAGSIATNHRSDERVPGRSSQTAQTAQGHEG